LSNTLLGVFLFFIWFQLLHNSYAGDSLWHFQIHIYSGLVHHFHYSPSCSILLLKMAMTGPYSHVYKIH
jgi:hypothetical protein